LSINAPKMRHAYPYDNPILTPSRTVDVLNKKGLAKMTANPFKIESFIGVEGQNGAPRTHISF